MKAVKRIALSVLLSLVCLFGMTNVAYAYPFTGAALNYSYPIVYYTNGYFSNESILGQHYSILKWNNASTVHLMSQSHIYHYYSNFTDPVTINGVSAFYHAPLNDYNTVAVNRYIYFGPNPSIITESDICYNAQRTLSNGAVPGCFDVETLALHELGHTVGLADTYDPHLSHLVMYGYITPGATKTNLTSTDLYNAYHRYHP